MSIQITDTIQTISYNDDLTNVPHEYSKLNTFIRRKGNIITITEDKFSTEFNDTIFYNSDIPIDSLVTGMIIAE